MPKGISHETVTHLADVNFAFVCFIDCLQIVENSPLVAFREVISGAARISGSGVAI